MLTNATSIAIWNRNKVVVTLAITVLGFIVALHMHSKSLPLNPAEDPKSHINVVW